MLYYNYLIRSNFKNAFSARVKYYSRAGLPIKIRPTLAHLENQEYALPLVGLHKKVESNSTV